MKVRRFTTLCDYPYESAFMLLLLTYSLHIFTLLHTGVAALAFAKC